MFLGSRNQSDHAQDLAGRCLPLQRPLKSLACASIVSFSFAGDSGADEARGFAANFFGPFLEVFFIKPKSGWGDPATL